jgi:hypothetical protein
MLKIRLTILSLFLLSLGIQLQAQDTDKRDEEGTEFKAAIEQFVSEMKEDHKQKTLNLRMREIGSLENEPFAWKEYFMLETKEEFENNLGYTTEREYYFLFYHYATVEDRQYALKYWLEDFIEGEQVRPGRPVRTYDYATPTLILINPTNIIILNYECKYFDDYDYDDWRDLMIEKFGDRATTMVIEIECDGPLEWTLNAPDPKVRGLF